ncbi:MFS general substrate transporter [Periconia macrospinosa]|uniref:MFS general substrate transporter n=1 Tax=Periconia macrospinosa TaxID=97972 RepID=A0A2V1DB30_9PLEO|nr:MFS general substrate transporter [Periconia macrospinosa]
MSGSSPSRAYQTCTVHSQAEMEHHREPESDEKLPGSQPYASSLLHETEHDTIEERKTPPKTLSFYLAFLALCIIVFIVSIDATALSVALPRIALDLHGTTLESFWASLSFLLAVAITQPLYNSISDVVGRLIPLYASFVFFFIGCVVFAVGQSMSVVITGRVLQGLGAGGLDVLSDVILADITTLKERPLYIGLFAIPMALGSILGPLLGALLSQGPGWRWIGWINLPIAGAGFILAVFFLRLKPIEKTLDQKLKSLDWIGLGLFALGSTIFTLPLSWAGSIYSWSSWRTLLPLLLGLLILIVLGFYERKPKEAVFPYRIFRNATAFVTLIGSFIHGAVLYSAILYLPLFFQAVNLETTLQSAISFLPLAASVVFFSVMGAGAVETLRKYRWSIVGSWVLSALGTGLWALFDNNSGKGLRAGLQMIAGAGLGVLFTVQFVPMQASCERTDDHGLAVGILTSFRLLGALIGISLCSTVFNSVFSSSIRELGDLPTGLEPLKDVKEAIGMIPLLRTIEMDPGTKLSLIDSYRTALMAIFLMLTGFSVLGLATSVFTQDLSLETEELGRQSMRASEKSGGDVA